MPRTEGINPEYKISDLDSVASPEYYGYVDKRGQWYIMRLTDTEARYSKGTDNYSTAWANRANLVYSQYNEVF